MVGTPTVSIVLPVYNDDEHVDTSIESVLMQSFESVELLVIDDGSTDATRQRLEEYSSDPRLTVVRHVENQGLPTALNTGLGHATGTYVMRQDADDRSLPGRLQAQCNYLSANPDIAAVTSGVEVIDDNGNVLHTLTGPVDPAAQLQSQNSIIHGATMLRREVLEEVGGYDEFFRFCQDYDLWVRLHRAGHRIRTIQRPMYQLRREAELLTVDRRRQIALYGLLARLPKDKKEQCKQQARAKGLDAVYEMLPVEKQGQYHRQLTLANVENRERLAALRNGLWSVLKCPKKPKSYEYLGVSLLPVPVADRVLSRVAGR